MSFAAGAHDVPMIHTPRHVHGIRLVLRVIEALSIAAIVVIVAAAIIWRSEGGNFYTVRTASMGDEAPVGTLAIDRPPGDRFRVGELITFTPPGTTELFTHRIYKIEHDGRIQTKGAINGAPDGWLLTHRDIRGRVVRVVRYVGWIIEALPILIIGSLLSWLFARFFVDPECRITARACGMLVVAVIALTTTHALVDAAVITFGREPARIGGAGGEVVSAGLLPVNVTAVGGTSHTITDGHVADVWTGWHNSRGNYTLHITPHWEWWWMTPLVLLALIPSAIGMTMPRRGRMRELAPLVGVPLQLLLTSPEATRPLRLADVVAAPAVAVRRARADTAEAWGVPRLQLDGVGVEQLEPPGRSAGSVPVAAMVAATFAVAATMRQRRHVKRR